MLSTASQDTPFERFLKEDDRLGKMSSEAWRAGRLKL